MVRRSARSGGKEKKRGAKGKSGGSQAGEEKEKETQEEKQRQQSQEEQTADPTCTGRANGAQTEDSSSIFNDDALPPFPNQRTRNTRSTRTTHRGATGQGGKAEEDTALAEGTRRSTRRSTREATRATRAASRQKRDARRHETSADSGTNEEQAETQDSQLESETAHHEEVQRSAPSDAAFEFSQDALEEEEEVAAVAEHLTAPRVRTSRRLTRNAAVAATAARQGKLQQKRQARSRQQQQQQQGHRSRATASAATLQSSSLRKTSPRKEPAPAVHVTSTPADQASHMSTRSKSKLNVSWSPRLAVHSTPAGQGLRRHSPDVSALCASSMLLSRPSSAASTSSRANRSIAAAGATPSARRSAAPTALVSSSSRDVSGTSILQGLTPVRYPHLRSILKSPARSSLLTSPSSQHSTSRLSEGASPLESTYDFTDTPTANSSDDDHHHYSSSSGSDDDDNNESPAVAVTPCRTRSKRSSRSRHRRALKDRNARDNGDGGGEVKKRAKGTTRGATQKRGEVGTRRAEAEDAMEVGAGDARGDDEETQEDGAVAERAGRAKPRHRGRRGKSKKQQREEEAAWKEKRAAELAKKRELFAALEDFELEVE